MTNSLKFLVMIMLYLSFGSYTSLQSDSPPATIVGDEGGVQVITGQYFPSTPSFRDYGSQPVVFLGDISNIFVEGAFDFSTENLNLESPQVMAYTQGDIRHEPLRYSIQLPMTPGGVHTDVDNDNAIDTGVGVYTVNFTFNGIGSPFIDAREFIAFSSITYSQDYETLFQINGGRMLIFTTDEAQGFPSGFGDDGEIFTADDPTVTIPSGYTVVDLNTTPFTFIRSNAVEMNIVESEGAEYTDFSDLSYTEAFDEMLEMMRKEYAFTEFKQIDWDKLVAIYRIQFVAAEAANDSVAYARALDNFLKSIPDGHVGSDAILGYVDDYFASDGGGVGLSFVELDDGRVLVYRVIPGSSADTAGILPSAEIISIDGEPITAVIDNQIEWFGPYSSEHNRRLEKVRFASRFPDGGRVNIEYHNPGMPGSSTAVLNVSSQETDSLFASPFDIQTTGFELPVEYEILPNGIGYVAIYSFSDDNIVTLLLWERAMRQFINSDVRGLIIDMRSNSGGSPDISNVMLGYLLDRETYIGTSAYYFEDLGTFAFDPLYDETIKPAADVYRRDIAVLVGPTCYSACEFFTYALTLRPGTPIIGYYPTGGLGGGIKEFLMPDNISAQFTVGRGVGADNQIHIEGTGIVPTKWVDITEENIFSDQDVLLDWAVRILDGE